MTRFAARDRFARAAAVGGLQREGDRSHVGEKAKSMPSVVEPVVQVWNARHGFHLALETRHELMPGIEGRFGDEAAVPQNTQYRVQPAERTRSDRVAKSTLAHLWLSWNALTIACVCLPSAVKPAMPWLIFSCSKKHFKRFQGEKLRNVPPFCNPPS